MQDISKKKQLGLYIHIPFCVRKCVYCDFLSGPADDPTKEAYVQALCREIDETVKDLTEQKKINNYEVQSIFFGGGTPSAIDANLIAMIMTKIKDCFVLSKDAEISMECNPGTLTKEKAMIYRAAGINRISFGLQSAHNTELKMLGRIHTFEQFCESMQIARDAGFDNINVDLMSALPGQTLQTYRETVEKVLALEPEHISAYSLIVEDGTALSRNLESYPELPDEDTERQMYYLTEDLLQKAGFEHYEISNYAKPGLACRHNLSYWERKDYLGFGTGAASLFENVRYSNISELPEYIAHESLDQIRIDQHKLSVEEQMEEFMFLGLRKIQGINEHEFSYEFTRNIEEIYKEVIDRNISLGMLEETGNMLKLTGRGIDVSNVIMSDFLLT